MKTLFEDLAIFEAAQPTETKPMLKIFDFDGTLFNSPLPNPTLWDRTTYGKLWGDFSHGGYGWFQNTLSLDDKYIDADNFNEPMVEEVKKSLKDPNSITVLLTGRTDAYTNQIKKILNNRGLVFDEYGFKPQSDDSPEHTMNFKLRFIRELIDKYNPSIIELWDDRAKHTKRFDEFLDSVNLNGGVHYIDSPHIYIKDPELEKELVALLIKDPRAGKIIPKHTERQEVKERKPVYWAVKLEPESIKRLIGVLKSEIPEGWRVFAHHMTIAFGKIKDDNVKEFLDSNIGKSVDLSAVEIGKSPKAMAVKIDSNVPSDNEISHVTIAVSPMGKPVDSNFITDWKKLDQPIQLSGKVEESYR
jgi:hypothetical protein